MGSSKNKTVQISEELFVQLAEYFLLDKRDTERETRIIGGLNAKWETLRKRELYTQMHNSALSEQERERARQQYLDIVGVPDGFRWAQDYNRGGTYHAEE